MSETFAALRINVPGDYSTLGIQQVPFPVLAEGQVLIKTEYSTINPSDVYTAAGLYPIGSFPLTIGLEGCGTVVKSGGGDEADSFLNKRVAFGYRESWAEYAVVPAGAVFPLLDSVPFEKAASLVVNPVTVALFLDVIQKNNHTAAIQNGAASALGKMLLRWCLHLIHYNSKT